MLGRAKRRLRQEVKRRPAAYNRFRAVRATVLRDDWSRVVSIPATGPRRGRALVSLVIEPFLQKPGQPIPHDHTQWWETVEIVNALTELGFEVDVIWWKNQMFLPEGPYDVFIDARLNLERLAPLVGADCIKVMRIDTAHWLFHTAAQHERLLALQRRRGVTLMPRKAVDPNLGIEVADRAIMLGNDFTETTYAFAGKPLDRIPNPSPFEYDWPDGKDFEGARRDFLWFGSGGLVHKGLDLVLEAFARMPDLRLTVCGPLPAERDFERAYQQELYETPNITTLGWVDIGSPEFGDLLRRVGAVVYPSCSEGQNGGVITCMHGAVVPVITYETGVDIDDFGFGVDGGAVEDVEKAVRQVAETPAAELEERSRSAWEAARARHTRARYAEVYRDIARRTLISS